MIINNEQIQGFFGITGQKVEMLFINSTARGKGYGNQLLTYVIEKFNVNELSVNEQNPQAVGFYKHMGFKTIKRSEIDDQGNPYPILRMKL